MSTLKRLARKLNPTKVEFAIRVHDKRKELAHDLIRERAKTDTEFAKDIIAAVGENLPKDIHEIASKTISTDANKLKELNH